MKKIIIIILCLILSGCNVASKTKSKEVEKFDWSEYDELLTLAKTEIDITKRNELLHKAEDMVIETGAIIPILNDYKRYLIKPECEGVYSDALGNIYYDKIYIPNKTSISINVNNEASSFDPQYRLLGDIGILWCGIGATLLTYDETDTLVGDLAERFEVSDDGLIYTYYLRDNLKWSDGKDLTADDIVYSWNRLVNPKFAFEAAEFLEIVEGYPNNLNIKSKDNGKVFEVKLKEPCVFFNAMIVYPAFGPLRQDIIESAPGYLDASGNVVNPCAWAINAPYITCGPYTLEKWTHNESMILKRNPNYYNADAIRTEEIKLMLNADATVCYAAYDSGDISLLLNKIPTDVIDSLIGNPEYICKPSLGTMYYIANTKFDLFADMSAEDAMTFRRALSFCIDRKFISQILSMPVQCCTTTIVPYDTQDSSGNLFRDSEGYSYPYETGYYPIEPDLDKAREMMKSIGLEFNSDGKLKNPINIEYLTNIDASSEAVATCIQADFAQIGVNLTIATSERTVYLGDRENGNFEFCKGSWGLDYNDPYSILAIFMSTNNNNDAQLGN